MKIQIIHIKFSDLPGTEYIVKHDESPGRAISKHALGKFLVECLAMPEHYEKIVGICNKPE